MTAALAAVIDSPLGRLGLRVEQGALVGVEFLPPATALRAATDAVAALACDDLAGYFADPRWQFSVPLRVTGTDHQRRVWAALQRIPAGAVRRYGELAAELSSAARAVGGACRANPLPIIIPCHRVVGRAGLVGYAGERAGAGIATKRWLLAHEGVAWPPGT